MTPGFVEPAIEEVGQVLEDPADRPIAAHEQMPLGGDLVERLPALRLAQHDLERRVGDAMRVTLTLAGAPAQDVHRHDALHEHDPRRLIERVRERLPVGLATERRVNDGSLPLDGVTCSVAEIG